MPFFPMSFHGIQPLAFSSSLNSPTPAKDVVTVQNRHQTNRVQIAFLSLSGSFENQVIFLTLKICGVVMMSIFLLDVKIV